MVLTVTSCSFSKNSKNATENNGQSVNNQKTIQIQVSVKIPTIQEIVSTLCSDEFEGRLVGSKGNEKAGQYIKNIFKDLGITPLFGDNYYEKYSQEVIGTYGGDGSDCKVEMVNNVVGVIKGKNSKNAVVISAHFDHIGYQEGKLVRGALDNASGVSALIQIAHILKEKSKEKPYDMDIIICSFNGEEEATRGSLAFVTEIKSKSLYNSLYNINIDSIGAKNGGENLALKNKSKISSNLYTAVRNTFKNDNVSFADTAVKGTGDNWSFENAGIPNVFIVQENIEKLVHKPTDNPDILDYDKINKIANAICDFVDSNDGIMFQPK